MHFVIYLPKGFYAAIASSTVEILQAINSLSETTIFTHEFVSLDKEAVSRSSISFRTRLKPSRKADILLLLAGAGAEVVPNHDLLVREARNASNYIRQAQKNNAIIASTCGAAYLLAAQGLLDGKRATISWWLRKTVKERFPAVKWEPSRIVIKQGRIYTAGGGFAGLELITSLLEDLGYAKELKQVRKLLVLPPARAFQSPYEIPEASPSSDLEKQLNKLASQHLDKLSLPFLAEALHMSERTISRRFQEDFDKSPGKWIQEQRISAAKGLLEGTKLSISEICYQIGYGDLPSFSRLFAKTTGMTPGEFRRATGRGY